MDGRIDYSAIRQNHLVSDNLVHSQAVFIIEKGYTTCFMTY
jgi:hypothetical protein